MTGEHPNPFGEQKNGFLARILGSLSAPRARTSRIVKTTERLSFQVPAENGAAVRAAVEEWLRGRDIHVPVTLEQDRDGKARIHADLGTEDAPKLDLTSDAVQAELERVLTSTIDSA